MKGVEAGQRQPGGKLARMLAALRQVAAGQEERQGQPAQEADHLVGGGEAILLVGGIGVHGIGSGPGTEQVQALGPGQRFEVLVVRRRVRMPACRNDDTTTSGHSEYCLQVIGSFRTVKHDQGLLACQRLAGGVAGDRERFDAKGAGERSQGQAGLGLPIKRMKKDAVGETGGRFAAGGQRPDRFGRERRLADAAGAAERHGAAGRRGPPAAAPARRHGR